VTERSISVLGAGSWGTALAILAARNNSQTLLWGHNPAHIASLKTAKQNQRYLPEVIFPKSLQLTSEIAEVAAFSNLLLIAVPSHAFKDTLINLRPHLPSDIKIAWATKGFNTDDGFLLHQTVENILGPDTPTAVLSGPTFANEVAANLPTAITIASANKSFAEQLAAIMRNPGFRVYTSSDIIGVQVGGAVKNVMAIAAGIADGLGFGANTRAALITRGLTEIQRLGLALGGKNESFVGLSGLGDLILTCTDNQSRNRRFGLAIGQGKKREVAINEINQEIEGISTAEKTYLIANKIGVEMPITEQVYKVLYQGLEPITAVQNLLKREQKSETAQ
jgi:glycerol-3-phosphate dehydrogenase (NAD(P)+)